MTGIYELSLCKMSDTGSPGESRRGEPLFIPPPGVLLPGAGQDAAFGQLEVLYGRRGNGLPGAVLAASEAAVHGDCKFDFGVSY